MIETGTPMETLYTRFSLWEVAVDFEVSRVLISGVGQGHVNVFGITRAQPEVITVVAE